MSWRILLASSHISQEFIQSKLCGNKLHSPTGALTFIAVVTLLLLLSAFLVIWTRCKRSQEYSFREAEERELATQTSTSSVFPGSVNMCELQNVHCNVCACVCDDHMLYAMLCYTISCAETGQERRYSKP